MENLKKKLCGVNYGNKICFQEPGGCVDLDPDGLDNVVGGDKLTYDEYLKIQRNSIGKNREIFAACYYIYLTSNEKY